MASVAAPVSESDTPPSVIERAWRWLPRGGQLPEDEWRRRHRAISVVLWLQLPILLGVGVGNGRSQVEIAVDLGVVCACALLGLFAPARQAKTFFVSLGLLCSSGALVHLTGGLIEAHFHFFVMLGLVALYQEWIPYLSAVAFVVLHHSIIGTIWPDAAYEHDAAQGDPFLWACIHAAFILGQIAVQVTVWKFLEQYQERMRAHEHAEVRALEAELELMGERRHRDYLENAVYELSHWKDLEHRTPT
jgi:hypothetical protein